MARGNPLILDRYEPLGMAGEGGFGTVQIAWDPRIQRKVAIKTIKLTAHDAQRASLPGAQAAALPAASPPGQPPTFGRWHGVQPWSDYLATEEGAMAQGAPCAVVPAGERISDGSDGPDGCGSSGDPGDPGYPGQPGQLAPSAPIQVTSLSHLPGLDEARTAAMLSDPRIVTVYDFEIRDRFAYLIMEYVEGITLTRLLADYPDALTLDMVAAVFDAVSGALAAAHGAGVLHLDIKPENIIINLKGQAKVTDFGLATLTDASGAGTTGGGTIGYMPLEQMRREHLDARADEWSLASVLYEMLTGENPFLAVDLADAEAAILDAELVLPSLCWEGLDTQIDDVVFYALDPDREERYSSVADFAEETAKFLGDAEEGRGQLSLVVEDALGLRDDPEDDPEPAIPPARRKGFLARLLGPALGDSPAASPGYRGFQDDSGDGEGGREDPRDARATGEGRSAVGASSREAGGPPRIPLAGRIGPRASGAMARAFAAAGSAFTSWLAFSNMPFLGAALGSAAGFITGVMVAVVAALGAILPHIGALVSFALLGAAIAADGPTIVGGALVASAALWWRFVARDGAARANVALAGPLLGAVGGASAIPLLAGAALRPVASLATTAFAAVATIVLAACGSQSPLGWDALLHWNFAGVDITSNAIALVGQPATWTTIAGWLAASAVFPLLSRRRGRGLLVLGLVAAATLVLAGSLALAPPSPQLIVSVVVSAVVLLAVLA